MLVTLYVFINLGAGLPVQPYPVIPDMPAADCAALLALNPDQLLGCGIPLDQLVPELQAPVAPRLEPAPETGI